MQTTNRLATALLALCALAGCGAAGVRVAHPAATGSLTPVPSTYLSRIERAAGSSNFDPDMLADTATIVRLDGEQVCFDVVTRIVRERNSGLAMDLESATLTYDAGTLSSPMIAPHPEQITQSFDREMYYTDDYGVTRTEIVTFEVVESGGAMCFAHGGALAASNRGLRLTYGARGDIRPTFAFQLDASPMPTAWPPGPIVAPGYEHLAR